MSWHATMAMSTKTAGMLGTSTRCALLAMTSSSHVPFAFVLTSVICDDFACDTRVTELPTEPMKRRVPPDTMNTVAVTRTAITADTGIQHTCAHHLTPTKITDNDTKQPITPDDANKTIKKLLDYVLQKTIETTNNTPDLDQKLQNTKPNASPTGIAWKQGITPTQNNLPNNIKATSRITRLIQHRTITERLSYLNNPNPNKKPPTITKLKANLGAVDKQMATIEITSDHKHATLNWKCWDRNLQLEFLIPENG